MVELIQLSWANRTSGMFAEVEQPDSQKAHSYSLKEGFKLGFQNYVPTECQNPQITKPIYLINR
ncbi:MAG: hypothetical protein D4R64_02160 [Porphyromonadaceae bacterium]|nr:MAG: hypothetical protein D4R64_02160 [Porphyromonadaceae bacterium]